MRFYPRTTEPPAWPPIIWAFRFALAFLLLWPVCAFGETVEAKNADEVRALIRDLGAGQFVVRENATKQLFDLGVGKQRTIVVDEITRASQESDREVRERAKRILALIQQRLREDGLKEFLAGGEFKNVPGWKSFSEKYGESEASRSVFTTILKEEWDLLATCLPANKESSSGDTRPEQDDEKIDDSAENQLLTSQIVVRRNAINRRHADVMNGRYNYQNIPLGTLLSFFLVGEAAPESFDKSSQLFHMMLSAPLLRQHLVGTPKEDSPGRIIRQIVANWMMAAIKHSSRYEAQALSTAMANQMTEESKQVAAHILQNDNSLVTTKRSAMQAFVVLRDPNGIELIEPYLTDETLLTPRRKKLQLRDMALTCLMDLHGHDVAEIGVKRLPSYGNPFDFPSLGFESDEERQKAFDLFEELQDEKARKKRESERKAKP